MRGINGSLRRMLDGIREFTVAQRTLAIIGLAVLLVGGVGLTAWLSRPMYSPLFSGLTGADASAIVELLKADGVEYELADGGATIMVPQDKVNSERLAAAAAGLPGQDSSGYSLLDKMGVTASEFQQSVTYKRALEGELAKTIEALDGVTTASVRLAIPEQSVFVEDKALPTASVFLDTRGGVTLSSEQVRAVTHLVSASVDSLTPDNVAVIAADGTVLSALGQGQTGSASEQASNYDTRVQASVQGMLDRVLGAGNSTVVVAADVSSESANRVSETFEAPTNAPVLSEQTDSQVYNGKGGAGSAGVLGPDNIAVPSGTSTDGSYTQASATRNNAINKTTETRTIPAGAVTRQTISVAVDAAAVGSLTPATLSAMVTAAAGIDPARGDAVSVQVVNFSTQQAAAAASALKAQQAAESQQGMTDIITTSVTTLGIVLGIIVIFALGLRAARRREDTSPVDLGELAATTPLAAGADQLLSAPAPAPLMAATPGSLSDPTLGAGLSVGSLPGETAIDRMRADIDALASANPQRTADYLRTIMEDRRPS